MTALRRDVLRELGQEIQRIKRMEVPLRPGLQAIALRVGEGPACLLLGLVDQGQLARIIHLRRVGQGRIDRWWVRTSRNRADLWPPAWEDADNSDR